MFKSLLFSFFVMALFVACGGPEGEAVASGDAVETETEEVATAMYNVDVAQSTIYWEGTKLMGGSHDGTINLSDGKLAIKGDELIGGTFTIDMASILNTDLPDEKKADLVGHLSNEDFFEVETYPTAKFEIKNVTPASGRDDISHMILGNLTMKDSTRSVSIPANVMMEEGMVKAETPQFTIDRTEWGIHYGSGAIGTAQDNVINDKIGLKIDLVAKQ